MTPTDDNLNAYVDAAVALHGFVIEPEWRPTIVANMKTIAKAAEDVLAYPLDESTEAAPVFTP